MNLSLLFENLTNPALLFFVLGIIAARVRSDLKIPQNSSKFISLYLLFAIGFKGGQELAHGVWDVEILWAILLGVFSAIVIPIYVFFIARTKFPVENAGAIAATYGSVSAVTFVTATSFLEYQNLTYGGHMIAVMALMEAPAIVIGVLIIRLFSKGNDSVISMKRSIIHSITNGSVLMIVGSLVIGMITSSKQAEGIRPFTTDIFKGFLAIFLLDMGITSGRKLGDFIKQGGWSLLMALMFPLMNGCAMAIISGFFIDDAGNRFILSILSASASYIAVPAAMRLAVPSANSAIFVPMALAITFPLNITLGMPIFLWLVRMT